MSKPKVAFYWCASCGGCEEAVVDLNEGLLDVVAAVDIAFWPVALDFKYADVEAMADRELDVAFINGAVRMDDQEHAVKLLRRKAKVVIAFGSCAHLGGIPGLSNLTTRAATLARAYREVPSLEPGSQAMPATATEVEGATLTLPDVWNTVRRLDEIVAVDYYLPGCPPQPETIKQALDGLLSGDLPAPGAVLSPTSNLCAECSRQSTRPEHIEIDRVMRVHEVSVPAEDCFLQHGVICMGLATRAGCGEKCMSASMPCRGCYGPTDGIVDQGAAFLGAFASLLGPGDSPTLSGRVNAIKDLVGTLYRFSLAASLAHQGELLNHGEETTP